MALSLYHSLCCTGDYVDSLPAGVRNIIVIEKPFLIGTLLDANRKGFFIGKGIGNFLFGKIRTIAL
jgi:hypothetical protein